MDIEIEWIAFVARADSRRSSQFRCLKVLPKVLRVGFGLIIELENGETWRFGAKYEHRLQSFNI